MTTKHHYAGLTAQQVLDSRIRNGENILTPPPSTPLWKQFLEKFRDPLIIILLVAGVLSVAISLYEYFSLKQSSNVFFEPVGIFLAIFLATGLSFYFEAQADKEFGVLNKVSDDEPVEVVRDGNHTLVAKREVVVGDVVRVGVGNEIPADGDLLEATHLSVDESTLTGEPICHKTVDVECFDAAATYPSNRLLRGTRVVEGHALMLVTAVGDATENGKVYRAAQIDNSVKTPLGEQLDKLGMWVSRMSYGVGTAVVVVRLLMYWAQCDFSLAAIDSLAFLAYLLQTLMIAMTLIVVSVPEGLPMAVTLSLAYSMRRMLKTNNLVRKLHACETMGATTVICTDKTGTLTQNRMSVADTCFWSPDRVERHLMPTDRTLAERKDTTDRNTSSDETNECDDSLYNIIKEGIAVNSTASLDLSDPAHPTVLGNPTEGALLLWLNDMEVDYDDLREGASVVDELPFSTERKYMATVVDSALLPGKRMLYVKGAPEIVYALCRTQQHDAACGDDHDVVSADTLNGILEGYQRRAMRIIGFAFKQLGCDEKPIVDGKLNVADLRFLGVAAIADPVRSEVPASIRECLDAGIEVKIVTGDTSGTAIEIGRQVGLWSDSDSDNNIITGPEFAALSDDQLSERVMDIKIISRARPMDKKRLVEALQRKNQVVAVTGDGTNDAPALKAAHVGLSMGDGTSVAKEASDITIIDNSFSSICKAVMWGRSLYQNIQRFLLFQLTVNVTACMLVLCGAFMGMESPLTVTQMLWINLIMDTFAAMALASLPPSEAVMRNRPRNRMAFIIDRTMMTEIVGVGGFFFALLVVLLYIFEHADIHGLTDLLGVHIGARGELTTYELTLLFTIFVMTHFFYLFNARAYATHRSALHLKGCNGLLFISILIFFTQIAMVELPGVQRFFNVESLRLVDWVIIVLGSSAVLWVRELWNYFRFARN